MKYKYHAVDRAAKKFWGTMDAENESQLREVLRQKNLRPLRIVAEGGRAAASSKNQASFSDMFGSKPGSTAPDLLIFTAFIRQLATMQGAGIPMVQSVQVLAEQSEDKNFGKVLEQVSQAILTGVSLTDALRRYPKVFDKIFINLISAGEVSGSLDKVLNRLAIYYEKAAALRRKIVSASTYPALILVFVTLVVIGLMMFVVPTISDMFKSNGKPLPAATQVIIDISNWMKAQWYVVVGAIAGAVAGGITIWNNEEARRSLDPYLLHVPIFGDLIRKIGVARFSRTFGTMLQSGVPIVEALDITARLAGNYAIEDAIVRTRKSITEGNTIAAPLSKSNVFPKMATSMIAIGEQTGALDQMLTKIAEFYEDEVDAKVSAMTSILEPLMIFIVGGVVAGILIPMYLPIFSMADLQSK